MRAIETIHNGYRFRSRTEARWAVFFDALGLYYEYERECFDVNGTYYLPDFYIPEHQDIDFGPCWIEVKGEQADADAIDKLTGLCRQSGCEGYILVGQPHRDGALIHFAPGEVSGVGEEVGYTHQNFLAEMFGEAATEYAFNAARQKRFEEAAPIVQPSPSRVRPASPRNTQPVRSEKPEHGSFISRLLRTLFKH